MRRSAVIFWLVVGAAAVAWYAAIPRLAPDTNAALRSAPIYRVSTGQKAVALTFDDGPDPVYTPRILDFLAKERIHATFFDTGSCAEQHPEIVKRELSAGHAVGSHTYSHRALTGLTAEQIAREIAKGARAVQDACGVRPALFRPPFGLWNRDVQEAAAAGGCRTVLWSVCLERGSLTTARELADRVIRLAGPGAIILIHAAGSRPDAMKSRSAAAMEIVVAKLKKQGYRFLTVPELIRLSTSKGNQVPTAGRRSASDVKPARPAG